WPSLGKTPRSLLADLKREASAQQRPAAHPIFARDFNEDALAAARANFRAAGIDVTLEQADATSAPPPQRLNGGLLATNPPYGDRLGGGRGQKGTKSFYFKLGDALAQWKGWRMSLLAGNDAFE